ncbi:MAG: type III pantothenate kinase [Gammaproteobacteria bacterium]|nr:type III pantothenate kinase [Gammaproteobacteria bacterium]
MQTLLVDVGNSRVKWALHDGKALHVSGFTHRDQDLSSLLTRHWKDLASPQRVIIASVTSEARKQQLADWIRQHWSLSAEFIVSPAQGQGLINRYREPEKLGCDRWAAMVAAYHAAHAAVCVVDCGSAVTLDVVDANGQHLGGLILPGVHTMHTALTAQTALTPVDFSQLPIQILGHSTREGIALGITHAISALVHQTLAELQATGVSPRCYLTGGDAALMAPLLQCEHVLEPDLVLQGLAIMAHAT